MLISPFTQLTSPARHLTLALLGLLSASLCLACSSQAPRGAIDERACAQTLKLLKERIGPELGKQRLRLSIPLSSTLSGCALVFSRVDEELEGEVVGGGSSQSSEELAIGLPNAQGLFTLTLVPPPPYREESARLDVRLMELHGAAYRELVITEQPLNPASRYQALQAFAFAEGVPAPKEIIAELLLLKTPEGLEVRSTWGLETFEDEPALVVKGAGVFKVFKWHEGLQRFKHDLAASARMKQSTLPSLPKRPATPTTTPAPSSADE